MQRGHYLGNFKTFEELESTIEDYIHFYNYDRLQVQVKLGCMVPCEYHDHLLSKQAHKKDGHQNGVHL
ncbi:IS3 family transposase [Syntrophomonas erecta]